MNNQTQNNQGTLRTIADNETVSYKIDGNEIKLSKNIIKQYIVGDGAINITDQEFKLFTELCKVRKLNPFLNEVYLIKYGNQPAQIVVGKDAILKRAILNENYDGMESGIIAYNQDTGEEIERQGTYIPRGFVLVGGWARVYTKNRNHPTYVSVNLEEVQQKKKDGTLNSNWSSKSATMVEKVAKVRALRETFIEDLGGMYDADEMPKEEATKDVQKQRGSDKMIIEQEEETESEKIPEATISEEGTINFNEL